MYTMYVVYNSYVMDQ